MALSTATITYDLNDLLGQDLIPNSATFAVRTNVPGETIVDTVGNSIRLGPTGSKLATGVGSVAVWKPGTGSNPASWQTYFDVAYQGFYTDTHGNYAKKRMTRTFGPFTITADADLADLVAEQEVPPTYLSQVTAELQEYVDDAEAARDAAVDISGISTSDAVVEALVKNTGGAGPLTSSALTASIGDVVDVPLKHGDGWIVEAFAAPSGADTPTLTIATSSQIGGGSTITPTTDYYADAHFRYDGTPSLVTASGSKVAPPTSSLGISYYLGIGTVLSSMATCEFIFGTTSAGTTLAVRAIVDGKWVGTYAVPFASLSANTTYWIKATWPGAKPRRVRLEVANAASFGGVVVPSGGTATRPNVEVVKRFLACLDSYGAGSGGNTTTDPATNGTTRIETFPRYVAHLLGCDSYINISVGGTGWVYDGGGGKSTFGQRVPDILAANPQIVLLGGSINDVVAGATFDQVYAAVSAVLAQLVSIPVVILTGPERDTTIDANYVLYNDAVRRAAAAYGRIFVDTLDTIKTGDYNAADTVHPSAEAHRDKLTDKVYNQLDRAGIDQAVAAAMGGRASVDLTLTASPGGAAATGATVTLTATQPFLRAGTVDFYDAGVKIGTGTIAAGSGTTGVATFATTALANGTHSLLASYRPTSPLVKPAQSNVLSYNVSANLGYTATFATDGPDTTTDNGKPWTSSGSGAWVNSGGDLTNPTASANAYHYADVGSPNYTATTTISASATGGSGLGIRMLDRTIDSSNSLMLVTSSGQIQLSRVEANSPTVLATGTGGTWAAGDVIDRVLNGTLMTVKKNGVNVTGLVNVDISTYANNTATKSGVGMTSSGAGAKFASVNTVPA